MLKKILLTITTGISISIGAMAQTDADVLRYGMLNYGSTARSLGMGNSFGALGADFSAAMMNPAGLGLYRRSEVTLSPFFNLRSTESDYLSNSEKESRLKFGFGDFGLVWATPSKKEYSEWKGFSFGIGYNKTNDFSGNSNAMSVNSKNSLLHSYSEELGTLSNGGGFPYYQASSDYNGSNADYISSDFPFDINLAWQTYLLDSVNVGTDTYYYNAIPYAGAKQTRKVKTRGGQGEWDFSFAANYENKLFLGATLGLTTVNYNEDIDWTETDAADTIPGFKSYTLSSHLKTDGTGINFKVGMIYKPIEALRIGLAIHTPTYYTLTDEYNTTISAQLEDTNGIVEYLDYASPASIPFQYDIVTPFRFIGSIAAIAGKTGAFNIEYEYIDYSMGSITPVDKTFKSDFDPANDAIDNKYTASHNIRVGGELRFDNLRFRVGAFHSTSPFKSAYKGSTSTDLSKTGITAGFGIRQEKYFIDFAVAHTETGSFLRPYSMDSQVVDGITYNEKDNRLLVTFGFNF
jgi:hypothetical protein